jgi:hypothetical protein
MGMLNLLLFKVFLSTASTSLHQFKNVPHFPPHFAHNSVHRTQVEIGGTLANLSTEFHALFNGIAEVNTNQNS